MNFRSRYSDGQTARVVRAWVFTAWCAVGSLAACGSGLGTNAGIRRSIVMPLGLSRGQLHACISCSLDSSPTCGLFLRGLGRRLDDYQAAEPKGKDGVEGGQIRTGGEQLAFIDFMLDACYEEVDYMTTALSRHLLRESVTHAYSTNLRLTEADVSPETMPTLLAVLIQGSLPRTEF